jgi:hypothetical protein
MPIQSAEEGIDSAYGLCSHAGDTNFPDCRKESKRLRPGRDYGARVAFMVISAFSRREMGQFALASAATF